MTRRDEHQAKVERVRRWLQERAADGALFTTHGGFSWVTAGGEGWVALGDDMAVGAILVTRERILLLTNTIEHRRLLDEELGGLAIDPDIRAWHAGTPLAQVVARLVGPARVVTEHPALASLEHEPGLRALRYTLLPPEVERYRRLARDAAEVVEGVAREVAPGVSEREIAASIARGCHRKGILPITNLVAADDRIRHYRHPIPTDRRVRDRAMLVLTGRRQGLHASLTRLVTFGPPDDELRRRHRAVTLVDAAYLAGSRPGRTLGQVLADGIRSYAEQGFGGEWELHHQGGLTGYAGREVFATPSAPHALDVAQCLAWNPSITGAKSEDTILVTGDGFEVLSSTGTWPSLEAAVGKRVVLRPDILVR